MDDSAWERVQKQSNDLIVRICKEYPSYGGFFATEHSEFDEADIRIRDHLLVADKLWTFWLFAPFLLDVIDARLGNPTVPLPETGDALGYEDMITRIRNLTIQSDERSALIAERATIQNISWDVADCIMRILFQQIMILGLSGPPSHRITWTKSKREFADHVIYEFEKNAKKYANSRRYATIKLFDKHYFKDFPDWTAAKCYDMVRQYA